MAEKGHEYGEHSEDIERHVDPIGQHQPLIHVNRRRRKYHVHGIGDRDAHCFDAGRIQLAGEDAGHYTKSALEHHGVSHDGNHRDPAVGTRVRPWFEKGEVDSYGRQRDTYKIKSSSLK